MREACRICGRELCGNQRRWIFHTAGRLNLQVLLSHVLGKEVSRDGRAEFACSKCAFMLERVYRFDTVIARIEALSLERLQKLLLEKDRLKSCIGGMYRRNNSGDLTDEGGGGGGDSAVTSDDARYSLLLQEDFAYSGFECWTEPEERASESHTCPHTLDGRPRRCRGCTTLRVADTDYEAVCKIPRKVARSVSCVPSSRWSASGCNEESPVPEPLAANPTTGKEPLDGESVEEEAPGSSLESLDATLATSPSSQKGDETDAEPKKGVKCDYCAGDRLSHGLSLHGNKLDVALSLVKAFECKPVQSPRGSKLPIPVKSSSLCQDLMDRSSYPSFMNLTAKSHSGSALAFPLEVSDLQELWEDLYMDYKPLQVKNLHDDQQTQCDSFLGEQANEFKNEELLEKINYFSANNKQLQEKLNEMAFELKSVQHASQIQDHKIQSLNETLKSKESESEELYHVIERQNETVAKLRDMLHRSQLGQLQITEGSSLQQNQQVSLLDMQNTLFFTQLEVQQLKRTQQQKDRQLAEARRTAQLLETVLQEERHQKEAAWKHNQELRATLQQLQIELQNKNWECSTLEREKSIELQRQEQKIQHLSHNLACKERLLQESKELLRYHENLDKSPTSADNMVQKLQQRIKDRDTILEQAVDEKFCMLEEREQEIQKLRLSVRERECDLKELRRVLSSNETTIQGLESLLKARGLELEQQSATYQNLQWLKEELEAKFRSWQAEQKGIMQQLQTALHEKSKEMEALSATLLCKLGPGQRDIVEEMCLRLQQKEQIIQELLRDRSRQAVEQETELQELLQAVSIREQQNHIFSEKMAQALIERSCELQVLRQQLEGQIPHQKNETSTTRLLQTDQLDETLRHGPSSKNTSTTNPKKEDGGSGVEKGVSEKTVGLEKQLNNAKKELELLTQKERESRLELSALQCLVASQEDQLQVQASDVESLTRSIQIKEELIKDLQMQLVDPEEMPAMERLTQEVLMLQEKVARVELQSQEATGNRKLQLFLLLEGLAAEKNQLNEALQAEKQLYNTLVKCHTHPDSSEQEHTLQVELERIQELRGQLEEALGRSLERLSRLESLDGVGGPVVTEDAEDASTEFTDSIEEEAAHRAIHQQVKQRAKDLNTKGDTDDSLAGHSGCPTPASVARDSSLQEELLSAKSEIQQILEQKKKLAEELQDLKGQIEEAGFSSVSHLRKTLLSLCLENAELKEQVGEVMLSEGWENEDEKEDENDLRLEVKKLREKLHTSEIVIGLLREQLTLNSQGSKGAFKSQFVTSAVQETEQTAKECTCQRVLHEDVPQWHCLQLQIEESSPSHRTKDTQVGGSSFGQQFMAPAEQLHSDLPQCRQQCHTLQNKLLVSEATIQAQTVQLEHYRALLSEPLVQQDSKQIQVDLQDLGYETCGRSENEADREEATSPECEERDEFRMEPKSWKKLLSSPPSKLAKTETFPDWSQCDDAAVLRQHVQDLRAQLQNSQRTIQSLQSCVRSMSTTSDYASGAEHAQKLKQDYALGSSPSHSMTDEDEGWHSDSFGSLCPPSLQPRKDLARLIHRVSLLEAELGKAKPKTLLPEELKSNTSMGKYDSLVQAQARELSHLRQTMREGQGLCNTLSQRFRDTIKSFEELLRGTDIDYFLGQSFREQLAQGNHLAAQLTRKLNRRNDQNMEDKSGHELLALRLSKELQEKEQIIKNLEAKLQVRSVTPSSSHTMSESPRSGSSASFLSDGLEGSSDMDDVSEYNCYQEDPNGGQPCNLLDTDLGRYAGKNSAQPYHSSPATASHAPTSESIQRNLTLPPPQHPSQITTQPSGGMVDPTEKILDEVGGFHPESLPKPSSYPLAPCTSRASSFLPLGPPSAPTPLLGCCRTPVFSLAEAQQELQMLQKQLGESVTLPTLSPAKPESLARLFSAGSPAISSKNCLQACHHVPQQLPVQNSEWNRKLLGTMEEHRPSWDKPQYRQPQEHLICGRFPSHSSATLSSQKLSGADLLEEHLSEIRILRQRLEESICTNDRLREQLETRLTSGPKTNGLETASQLPIKSRVLQEDHHNLHLQIQLSRLATDLQEALRASHSKLHDGEVELEEQRIKQKHLQEEIWSKQKDLVQLQEACLALQENNSRLQNKVVLLQQQSEENRLLFQTLQAELRVYEVLCGSGTHTRDGLVQLNNCNKQGVHVMGHFKHWNTLRQQMLEGKALIQKMESHLQPGLEPQNWKVFHPGNIKQLLANTSSLHQILEKSSSLLGMFWKAALPTPPFSAQDQAMQIQALKAKLAEHECHLQSASHIKDCMENFLLTHLTRTYNVLKKARTNLEGMSLQPTSVM